MRLAWSFTLLLFVGGWTAAGCAHHHHRDVYRMPRASHHLHRLDCGHLVSCRYERGRHHYRLHSTHQRYYHEHAYGGGRYERCYVARGRHYRY